MEESVHDKSFRCTSEGPDVDFLKKINIVIQPWNSGLQVDFANNVNFNDIEHKKSLRSEVQEQVGSKIRKYGSLKLEKCEGGW